VNTLGIICTVIVVGALIFVPKLLKVLDKTFDFKTELQENIRYRTALDIARVQYRIYREGGDVKPAKFEFEVSQDIASLLKSSNDDGTISKDSSSGEKVVRRVRNQNEHDIGMEFFSFEFLTPKKIAFWNCTTLSAK